jgi:2-isopropylmalate synthase
MKIEIYDTTLRDGTQRTDISLSADDKMRIARRLDELGIDYIEGGWPGSNPKDAEFFRRAREMTWQHAVITSFGSTCRANTQPADDANIQALVQTGTAVCTIVGKSWDLHVTEVLQTTLEENLRIIEQSTAYLVSQGRRVMYDAEHFFDGFKANPQYALETLKAAHRGGAEILVLCDTNGGSLPWDITAAVNQVQTALPNARLGIHAHNDTECAVANSLSALRAGCVQVQGTINGYGERCGNANLCSIIPDLEIKLGLQVLPEGHLPKLFEMAHYLTEVANLSPDDHLPYVGRAAFAHKAGLHVAGLRRSIVSYQHIDPILVGNEMHIVVSELAGRGSIASKAEQYGLDNTSEDFVFVLNEIKTLEAQGFAFDAAEASVVLMLKRQNPTYHPPFDLIDFSVLVEHRRGRGIFAEATVKVSVDGEVLHTVSEGNGPVGALDGALRKALAHRYPKINGMHLKDYKVRILDSDKGTSATTRVLIDTQYNGQTWSTVGASANIIEASWRALADSVEYGLMVVGD